MLAGDSRDIEEIHVAHCSGDFLQECSIMQSLTILSIILDIMGLYLTNRKWEALCNERKAFDWVKSIGRSQINSFYNKSQKFCKQPRNLKSLRSRN